eukprot:gene11896-biopygen3875
MSDGSRRIHETDVREWRHHSGGDGGAPPNASPPSPSLLVIVLYNRWKLQTLHEFERIGGEDPWNRLSIQLPPPDYKVGLAVA